MGAIKITPADKWFSKCIRLRAGWCCQRCGAQHHDKSRGLHCSHVHGRGAWGVRFDPDNALALCYGCHQLMGSRPEDHRSLVISILGDARYDLLNERLHDKDRGREYRKTKGKGEISAHYKAQFEALERFETMDFTAFI